MKFANITNTVKAALSKHSPEILVGFGIAGMLTTTVLAVKATPKAMRLIEEKKEELKTDKLTPVETVKATWKCYIPSAATAGVSIACLIGSSKISNKRNAVLATAYKIAENAHNTYREKVIETIGEKKEQLIRDEVNKDKIEKNPPNQNTVIMTGKGETLFYDGLSGRYFKSDIDKIRKIENELNRRMRNENYISLNEFYDELGLEHIRPLGDDLGWNIEKGYIEIHISPLLTPDDEPCIALDFEVAPMYDYSKL